MQGPRVPRRAVLALPAGLVAPPAARADTALTGADALLLVLSDLHSAMERAAAMLGAMDAVLAANRGVPAFILLNGDVFERGNAVALRSDGAADWAFLAALRRRAPVVLNIGNHETALIDDLAEVVARARALDLRVVSNLRDWRTGLPFAEVSAGFRLPDKRRLRVVGLATDAAATYRAPARALIDMPEPVAWARERLHGLFAEAEARVLLSHAGVAADRAILPLLPGGTLLVGGHEHLRFAHAEGATRYLHCGSWNRALTVVGLGLGGPTPQIKVREVAVEPGQAEDAAHAALVRQVTSDHLAPEDAEVLFHLPAPLPLPQAARAACAALARATGSRAGLLGHTGFGTGLPGGPVRRLDFDAFLRFDGPVFRGNADLAALASMAPRLNQDEAVPLAGRIGDYAYVDQLPRQPALLASNGWVRMNAAHFLGAAAPRFDAVPDLALKSLVAAALARR
ncbi:bifunctional metallophosphatase/5'-nucleotidase [Roseomonas frigidaquae]|uniref:Bifunctional metallophosphatase/5'-nucleotidase n=1 Tax=Falsiroseomonas frigidaquae TaxID=487318 RepID=A0ABX1F5C0_9PROT|nr:metallophosphoesterase [Falsiroseomonas frigidaquae]NKE47559.1 bifunctional metallophosphatase/5'-nucleotidase [Falsiroseomonas frigidaquae]